MADSSLDDFFAKKDKSKKKTKTKSVPGDGDDGSTKPTKKEKKKKDKDKQASSGGSLNILTNPQEDEEWKDFEEVKQADYTGLRIQTLQIAKDDQDRDTGDGDENGDDEDGDNRDRKDGASGPWNKSNTSAPAAVAASVSHSEPAKEEPASKTPARYIPPAQRQAAMTSTSSFPSSRKKKEAPNVHSEEDFPMLGGGPGKSSGPQYSSTASSDLIDNTSQRKGVSLTLENKFSALQD